MASSWSICSTIAFEPEIPFFPLRAPQWFRRMETGGTGTQYHLSTPDISRGRSGSPKLHPLACRAPPLCAAFEVCCSIWFPLPGAVLALASLSAPDQAQASPFNTKVMLSHLQQYKLLKYPTSFFALDRLEDSSGIKVCWTITFSVCSTQMAWWSLSSVFAAPSDTSQICVCYKSTHTNWVERVLSNWQKTLHLCSWNFKYTFLHFLFSIFRKKNKWTNYVKSNIRTWGLLCWLLL